MDTILYTSSLQEVSAANVQVTPSGGLASEALASQLRHNNYTATVDPGTGNDSSQGYGVGSVWINQTGSRVWRCLVATVANAVWALDGEVPGTGVQPSSLTTYFGGGTGTVPAAGGLNVQISATGVQPGGTAVDSVLAVFSIPASSFDVANRTTRIRAQGSFGATGNNKRLKIIANPSAAVVGSAVTGGTTIADTGTVTTNGGGWRMEAALVKYGAAGSNTQLALQNTCQVGGATVSLAAPALLTATESGAILVAITGNAATAVSDIVLNFFEVTAQN